MGKTPVPLTIHVDPEWLDRAQIKALQEKGHTVLPLVMPDLILSSRAHWWHDGMWARPAWLESALKVARERAKVEKPKPEPKKKKGKKSAKDVG